MALMKLAAVALWGTLCGGMELTLLHTGDLHSRVGAFNGRGDPCTDADERSDNCFGGLARLKTAVQAYRRKFPTSLLLDSGDAVGGAEWEARALPASPVEMALNDLQYDASTLGRQELDQGLRKLTDYLRNLDHKVVVTNLDSSGTPLAGWVRRQLIVSMGPERIGVLAYLTPRGRRGGPDQLRLVDEVDALRDAVRELERLGIDKIIVLGHAGLAADRRVCREVRGVDVVIGGLDHSLLFNGDAPTFDDDVRGDYPEVVNQTGSPCLIAHAGAYGKYLGLLQVNFDERGTIDKWAGNPVLLDATFPEDEELAGRFEPLLSQVRGSASAVPVGEAAVSLHYARDECRGEECNLGNLVTDAAVDNFFLRPDYEGAWTQAAIGLWNSGAIGDFESEEWKDVTLGDVRQWLPHSGDMVELAFVSGRTLREMMENAVSRICNDDGRFLQVSGLRVLYDLTKPIGNRVIQLDALCSNCTLPKYETVHPQLIYPVATSSFLMHGALGYSMLQRDQVVPSARAEVSAMDAVLGYVKRHSPLKMGLEGRIRYISNLGPAFHCKFIPDVAVRPETIRRLSLKRSGGDRLLEAAGPNDQRHKYVLRFSQEKGKLVFVRQPNFRLPPV